MTSARGEGMKVILRGEGVEKCRENFSVEAFVLGKIEFEYTRGWCAPL